VEFRINPRILKDSWGSPRTLGIPRDLLRYYMRGWRGDGGNSETRAGYSGSIGPRYRHGNSDSSSRWFFTTNPSAKINGTQGRASDGELEKSVSTPMCGERTAHLNNLLNSHKLSRAKVHMSMFQFISNNNVDFSVGWLNSLVRSSTS